MALTVLDGVMLLAADTARARAYVDLLRQSNLAVATAVVVRGAAAPVAPAPPRATEQFDNVTPLEAALDRAGTPVTAVTAADINAPAVCAAVAAAGARLVVLAGPAAAIVKAPLFDVGVPILHVHPGRLPDFRGSTPMYYSLLTDGQITATALLLAAAIDAGPVVAQMTFAAPADRTQIDHVLDPWMRATLLVQVLQQFAATGSLEAAPQEARADALFVIHPVLKHLAILGGGPRG